MPHLKLVLISLGGFLLLNGLVLFSQANFSRLVSFNRYNYDNNSYHFFEDVRKNETRLNLLRALGQFDAQWYLRIASVGYPKVTGEVKALDKQGRMVGQDLSYAFFPVYPLSVRIINVFFNNIETAAFSLMVILLMANFFSLYYVVSKLFDEKIALKTIFLIFAFPFSVFFRSYYTESLFLFWLTWFGFFLVKKKYFYAAVFLAMLNITRGTGWLLNLLFFFGLFQAVKSRKIPFRTAFVYALVGISTILMWSVFNFSQTGDWLFFQKIGDYWQISSYIGAAMLHNLASLIFFPLLPLHDFHFSKIDTVIMISALIIIIKSRRLIQNGLWWIGFLLWLLPFLIHDTMSFSRFMIVVLPIFIYLASILKSSVYFMILASFILFMFVWSLYFINWIWIG